MSTLATRTRVRTRFPKLGRLGYLMALYGENFLRLQRMFELSKLEPGRYRSAVGDALDLQVDVIERHRYTLDLRLTYELRDPETGEPDPSAYVRVYFDSRQAEASHCYLGRRWQDVLGLRPALPRLIGHRMRMNSFLSKWLEYLAEQGHSRFTLLPAERETGTADTLR
ncbi:MAG TPA: DUF1249 domain-containing protein [Xanthomonadaceae bacterium]|nr:DUF1249 domain-containing protein [Xanthomonadaceae bacterium]